MTKMLVYGADCTAPVVVDEGGGDLAPLFFEVAMVATGVMPGDAHKPRLQRFLQGFAGGLIVDDDEDTAVNVGMSFKGGGEYFENPRGRLGLRGRDDVGVTHAKLMSPVDWQNAANEAASMVFLSTIVAAMRRCGMLLTRQDSVFLYVLAESPIPREAVVLGFERIDLVERAGKTDITGFKP